ncbi:MAG: RES family NAD+ phosphorylase [Flavobacteriales bacterium]|nr:RES family NAD+ phosphorylase [Flavobacteriales bacterium]
MIVFRLSKSKYATDLSGRGTETSGGRWNSKGVAMLYTSESRALCTTEIAVHAALGNLPNDYSIIIIKIPDKASIKELAVSKLPPDWQSFPHSHSTQKLGDQFSADHEFLVLKVPSAVVDGDHNFLLNPNHKDFGKVSVINIEPFTFDERLFAK